MRLPARWEFWFDTKTSRARYLYLDPRDKAHRLTDLATFGFRPVEPSLLLKKFKAAIVNAIVTSTSRIFTTTPPCVQKKLDRVGIAVSGVLDEARFCVINSKTREFLLRFPALAAA